MPGLFCFWKRIRNEELTQRTLRRVREKEFVRDLAQRHLPNIYRTLNTIAEREGIHLEEQPMVNYVDMRNGGRHRQRSDAQERGN